MAQSYSHLLVKTETKEKVMLLVSKIPLSEQAMKLIKDWVVFEKEAEVLMSYLTQNPQVSEETLVKTVLQTAWNYAKTTGMSPAHRECYSAKS